MELRHLRYFVAVAEEQSFTRAAERLWVAQPGLSTQIRRLEEELGVTLFERHTRGANLTDAGRVFLERARATLAAADDARATGNDLESGLVGTIRLGLATEASSELVPSLLERFAASRPDVEITVIESHGGTLVRDLRDGRLDALIAPSVFGSPELHRISLGTEAWAVLVGPGHRLARPGPVTSDELDGEEVLVTGHRDGAGYDRAVAAMLAELGLSPALRRGGPGPALLGPVADGQALALGTAAGPALSDVLVRPLRPARDVSFELLWRDESPAPALRELIRAGEALVASAEREPKRHLAVAA
jgi:DNA-binding transcriptional LysR family regulator